MFLSLLIFILFIIALLIYLIVVIILCLNTGTLPYMIYQLKKHLHLRSNKFRSAIRRIPFLVEEISELVDYANEDLTYEDLIDLECRGILNLLNPHMSSGR